MMANDCIKVKKGTLVDCLTCPLCLDLFREATTICLCLHTFCKDCLWEKFVDNGKYCCPVCNVYLGYTPQDKLRPDNNLQNLRMTFFPSNKSKELGSKCTLPTTRKKKRSLSSLVTRTNLAVTPSTTRTKAVPQKSRLSQEMMRKPHENDHAVEENKDLNQKSSPQCSNKLSVISKKQILCEEPPPQVSGNISGPPAHLEACFKETDKDTHRETLTCEKNTIDLNIPLLDLPESNLEDNEKVDAKNLKKKGRARGSLSDQRNDDDDDDGKAKNCNIKDTRLRPRLNGVVKVNDSREQILTTTSSANAFSDESMKRLYPIWLTLFACKDKNGDTYPQLPKPYIRIKDGNIPISYINKYLVQKLNLKHESEVEVTCCGQTLVPNATLNSVVDIWLQFTSNIGPIQLPSKEDEQNYIRHNFVMALAYRKGCGVSFIADCKPYIIVIGLDCKLKAPKRGRPKRTWNNPEELEKTSALSQGHPS